MNLRLLAVGVGIAWLPGSVWADWDLRVTEVFASDETGARREFRLGEGPVFLTVRVKCQGTGAGTYDLDVELAGKRHTFADQKPENGATASFVWSPGFNAHVALPYRVRLTPRVESAARSRPEEASTGEIKPVYPEEIEWYGPRQYEIRQRWSASFPAAKPTEVVVAVPVIAPGLHQQVQTWTKDERSVLARLAPIDLPVLRLDTSSGFDSPVVVEQRATVRVRSFRVNPGLLEADWKAYEALPYDVRPFQANPEPREGERAALDSLFASALPEGGRDRLSPRETAERLFMATLGALQYDAEGHAKVVEALRDKVAVCEAYAETYARLLRMAHIPVRVVNGWIADGAGGPKPPLDAHSWVEVWFVGAGWVPQDPTFADTAAPGATVPFYFYTVPDMNRRIAVSYNVPYKLREGLEPVGLVGPAHWYRFEGNDPKPVIDRVFTIEPLEPATRKG
ncbi:MAG: transglutaminase domain-containing protein [Fimbriimonadaceae bacterium]|nr:transglutaminase domain-containing protein [Fimbriimonadaceae bacterium]